MTSISSISFARCWSEPASNEEFQGLPSETWLWQRLLLKSLKPWVWLQAKLTGLHWHHLFMSTIPRCVRVSRCLLYRLYFCETFKIWTWVWQMAIMGFSGAREKLEVAHLHRCFFIDIRDKIDIRDIRHSRCAFSICRVVVNLKVPIRMKPMKPAFVSFVSFVSFGFAWRTFQRMNLLWTFWRLHVHVQLIWNFHKHQSRELHVFWDTFRRTLLSAAFSGVSNVSFRALKIKGLEGCVSRSHGMCLSELRSGKMTPGRWCSRCLSSLSAYFPAQMFFSPVMLWMGKWICAIWLWMILRLLRLALNPPCVSLTLSRKPSAEIFILGHPSIAHRSQTQHCLATDSFQMKPWFNFSYVSAQRVRVKSMRVDFQHVWGMLSSDHSGLTRNLIRNL